MAGAVGRAFVQVFADLSKFSPGLREKVKSALDEQTKGIPFEELDKSAAKAGESAADEVGKGVDSKIDKNMDKEGRKGGASLWKGLSKGLSAAASLLMPALIAVAALSLGAAACSERTQDSANADANAAPVEVLADATSAKSGKTFPQVFVVKHPQARIAGLTLGHDARAHDLPEYQTLLKNAVQWVGGK
jgi:hypothetical protein